MSFITIHSKKRLNAYTRAILKIALAAPLLANAITCVDNGDGTWTCSGEGMPGTVFDPLTGITSCTNCVNMSPSACLEFKNGLYTALGVLTNDILSAYNESQLIRNLAVDFKAKWLNFPDSYLPNSFGNNGLPSSYCYNFLYQLQLTYQSFTDLPEVNYLNSLDLSSRSAFDSISNSIYFHVTGFSSDTTFGSNKGGVVATYFYSYFHSVHQFLNQIILPQVNSYETRSDNIGTILLSTLDITSLMSSAASTLNCDTCQLSSGSSSSSGSSGSSTYNCPECLKTLLQEISSKVSTIQQQLTSANTSLSSIVNVNTQCKTIQEELLEKFKSYSETVEQNLNALSNLVYRIDDYVETDQKQLLQNINQAVIVLSNDVDSVQKRFFTLANKSLSFGSVGDTDPLTLSDSSDMVQTASNVIKELSFTSSTYKQYDWFSRIEMLLLHIAGVGAQQEFQQVSQQQLDNMKTAGQSLANSFSPSAVQGSANTVLSSTRQFVTNVQNLYPSGNPVSEVVLLQEGSWISDQPLKFTPPTGIQNYCHLTMRVIWSCLGLVLFVKFFAISWVSTLKVLKWYLDWLMKMFLK